MMEIMGSRADISGRGRRERMMSVVREGRDRHWVRISPPMNPDVPVRMNFISGVGIRGEPGVQDFS